MVKLRLWLQTAAPRLALKLVLSEVLATDLPLMSQAIHHTDRESRAGSRTQTVWGGPRLLAKAQPDRERTAVRSLAPILRSQPFLRLVRSWLFLEHFFDLPDLLLNFAGQLLGLAFSL